MLTEIEKGKTPKKARRGSGSLIDQREVACDQKRAVIPPQEESGSYSPAEKKNRSVQGVARGGRGEQKSSQEEGKVSSRTTRSQIKKARARLWARINEGSDVKNKGRVWRKVSINLESDRVELRK